MTGHSRTAEFIATVNSRRERPQWIQQRQNGMAENQSKMSKLAIDPNYCEFMRISKICSNKIRDSFEKLEKFTLLASRKAVLDDGQINRLIAEIRADISESKKQLDYLQERNALKERHSDSIVNTLQQRLANETSTFKSTLELRSKRVQQESARYDGIFTYSGASNQNSSVMTPAYDNYNLMASSSNGNPIAIDMGAGSMQAQQQILRDDQIDSAERADKMHLIESTIVELSTVFNQLADMVHDQGATITRIDMNISETTGNVEAAHDALLNYFSSINNNRWLILKVFGLLFVFFVLFVMFAT